MAAKKQDSTGALVTVIKALEPLDDGDRQWVLQSAAARWSLSASVPGASGGLPPGTGAVSASAGDVQSAIAKKDGRAFMRIKRPQTDIQRVACLGYFLIHTTGQQGFSSKDIGKAHTDPGGSAMNMTRALDNATRKAKYLSSRGPREKQLTTLGEDVAMALPDQQAVKQAEAAAKGRGKRRGKQKSRKKA